MVGVGVLLGLLYFEKQNPNILEKQKFKLYNVLFISFVFGFFGSRFFELIYFSKTISINNLLTGGSTFMGGLFSALFISVITTSIYKLDYISTLNTFIPFILISHFFGRIGCFLAGCCFGKETNCEIIGVTFPQNSIPFNHYGGYFSLHPTQLYEALGLLFLFLFIRNKKNKIYPYLILYGLLRFQIEFFRNDNRGEFLIGYFSPSQVFSILFILIGSLILIKSKGPSLFKK